MAKAQSQKEAMPSLAKYRQSWKEEGDAASARPTINRQNGLWLCYVISAFLVVPAGCHRSESNNSRVILNPAAFNATNAFAEVKALTEIVPRSSGSFGAKKAAEHLSARLRAMGINAVIVEFEDNTPDGSAYFRNVIGTIPAQNNGKEAEAWIILGAHYDTKSGLADNFSGANDSGSGVGILLELARVIKNSPDRPVNFLFAFFDGEECKHGYTGSDGLHGSRRLADELHKDGRAAKIRAVIVLDMVGDRNLNVTIPRNSTSCLISDLFKAAEAEGARCKFTLYGREILDDHQPFLSGGMPAIDIIDFEYGSVAGKNDYWHTPADTIDKISAESLEIIGRTVLRLLDDSMARIKDIQYNSCRI